MPILNEHLEHFVTQALLQAGHLSTQRIDVTVREGTVQLDGQVQTFRRKLAAQKVVQNCNGVERVINDLKVVPPDDVSDDDIALEINNRLDNGSDLNGHSIRIDCRNGIVVLSGYVSNSKQQFIASDIAASVNGVREVRDLLIVNPDRVLANTELCIAIGAAMNRIIGMQQEDIQISVIDDTARLSGCVDAPWKRDAAEKTVRQFRVFKVCNEIQVESCQS